MAATRGNPSTCAVVRNSSTTHTLFSDFELMFSVLQAPIQGIRHPSSTAAAAITQVCINSFILSSHFLDFGFAEEKLSSNPSVWILWAARYWSCQLEGCITGR